MAQAALRLLPSLCFAIACGGTPPPPEPDPPVQGGPLPADFSGEHAWSHLEMLAGLGPRPIGSDGATAARAYIAEQLAVAGLSARSVGTTAAGESFGPIALTHLVATLPGRSKDRFVLMAPYGSGSYDEFAFGGANDGASGAALLLELARVLARHDRPYDLEFVWIEGEGRLGLGQGAEREQRWLGSKGLAARWSDEARLDGIRLLAVFNRVCDADLRVARDLGSHRAHREEFWRAARRLGRGAAFPPTSPYESVTSSHSAFRARGLRRVLAIEDTAFGGAEAPGLFAGENDVIAHCAPASLEAVGAVAVEAIATIGARLEKIDRYARTPAVEPEPEPEPEAKAPGPEAVDPWLSDGPPSAPGTGPGATGTTDAAPGS